MNRRHQGGTLSERLRAEVQVSATRWPTKPRADNGAALEDVQTRGIGPSRGNALEAKPEVAYPCPHHVKSQLFFYKYLQPLETARTDTLGPKKALPRKVRLNLPLTVVCEHFNAKETVLWLYTDAHGTVCREDKTLQWRKQLSKKLLSGIPATDDRDPLLAVRRAARWKNNTGSSGGSALVLSKSTLEPVLAAPCELPTCFQQFVHCRGTQPSVYRIFWYQQLRKCFAVNLTISLNTTEALANGERIHLEADSGATSMGSNVSGSTKRTIFEAAMRKATQMAQLYCVTDSPDERACARWPKLRGSLIAEGVEATSRIVEHAQLRLSTVRFHAMVVDFIKDTSGVWWFMRVVDFNALSLVEPPTTDECIDMRNSAVLLPASVLTKHRVLSMESQLENPASSSRDSTPFRSAMNTRSCFLCGCSCELPSKSKTQIEALVQFSSSDEVFERHKISSTAPVVDGCRMTLTMALDTIFLMRQRGVSLSTWELAVNTMRKSRLRGNCDFATCLLCYQIYQQQSRLQNLAKELHGVLSSTVANVNSVQEEPLDVLNATFLPEANKAISRFGSSQSLDGFPSSHIEAKPSSLVLRGDIMSSTETLLRPLRETDMDPTASQLRLVFFFHELQDAGPDLIPTDFYLEYQLGQSITQVHLEGSKRHTPNRWQLCEARVHYVCASLEAFSGFCARKQVLIRLKTHFCDEDDVPIGSARMEKETIFGYTLLPLQAVNTTANLVGKSRHLESRTDFLLELQTASHGLLMLKLTVGLLVDPVPLRQLRDMICDLLFQEERSPRGVYWPPASHFLSGLAVPQDWIDALMPSEYTKQSTMFRKGARRTRKVSIQPPPTAIITPFHPKRSFLRRSSPEVANGNGKEYIARMASATVDEKWIQKSASCDDIGDNANNDQKLFEYRSQSPSVAITESTLSQACLIAKRMVSQVTEDAVTAKFPTLLLAIILRNANLITTWKSLASFHFTRRYTLDRLLAEVKPGLLPTLVLLGELMLVLVENQELPVSVDASVLNPLLEPFWQHESEFRLVPRTQTSCLPRHRVFWNRAIRRWQAASSDNLVKYNTRECADSTECNRLKLQAEIGDFRAQKLKLLLCDLFEQMEASDSGYIEIAELRSLAKCLGEQHELRVPVQLAPDVGMRERLRQKDVLIIAELIEQQRRLSLWNLLYSLLNSSILVAALSRFDRTGSGEMSFEKFGELASEALLAQRHVLRALHEEPRKEHDGFCLRHGFSEIYAFDSVCVHCAVKDETSSSLQISSADTLERLQPLQAFNDTKVKVVHERKRNSDEGNVVRKSSEIVLHGTRGRKSFNIRRASAPEIKLLPCDAGSTASDESFEFDFSVESPRRQEVAEGGLNSQESDKGPDKKMNRRHTRERPVVKEQDAVELNQHSLEGSATFLASSTVGFSNVKHKSFQKLTDSSQTLGQVELSKTAEMQTKKKLTTKTSHHARVKQHLEPTSEPLSKLLRMEFCERTQTSRANRDIIEKTMQIDQRRKELDSLLVAEVQQVKERLAKLRTSKS